jgi:preprotein translocase subunit SecA
MAGRGTDIKPANEVLTAGGLHVLICEHHDSSRVDRQFVGRTGRQGNPGSYEYFVSLDDPVMEAYGSLALPLARTLARSTKWGGMAVLTWAQRRIEAGHGKIRRELSKFDEESEKALSFAGEGE